MLTMKPGIRVWGGAISLFFLAGCVSAHKTMEARSDITLGSWTYRTDRWDDSTQGNPLLSRDKALQAAERFVNTVALREDMKAWRLSPFDAVKLRRIMPAPGEWLYVVTFLADPKALNWNGPVPSLEIPVRFDGTVPEPTNTKETLTSEQATTAAIRLANDKAYALYQHQPFADGRPARIVAGHWLWAVRQGYGNGDIQATVELALDGSTNSVDLQLLDSLEPFRQF